MVQLPTNRLIQPIATSARFRQFDLPRTLTRISFLSNDKFSIIIAVAGVPGVLLGTALIEIPHFGRKWSMVLSSALMATSLFLYAIITTPAASVGFNAMEYFCACFLFAFYCAFQQAYSARSLIAWIIHRFWLSSPIDFQRCIVWLDA